ncbi:hypothetical protein [Pseudooctadecabacter jejudonensis]|uniref:Uncharacterized protein n=1 Tax=Pseudooctadecabacter jejudonensis TaxID=1391910 RepID=A0A1Y5S8E8_9RHOB|nr:hypothetical protein [Pseudooctadecabacter jejudonensis]SLN34818.1 hypothetical protein PSJ8397_01737 [Pseudooctadecabacter jejudonensis]
MGASDSLSGSWTGRYDYDNIAFGSPVSFDAVLTETAGVLRGEIVEPNTFRSQSTDTLLAVLVGDRTGARVQFTKTYTDFEADDNPVYTGQINATATRITGQWHFPKSPQVKGTFLFARTAQAAVRRSIKAAAELEFEDTALR